MIRTLRPVRSATAGLRAGVVGLTLSMLVLPVALIAADEDDGNPSSAPGIKRLQGAGGEPSAATANPQQEVVIKREALKLTDPRTYRASLHLDSARTIELVAPVDAVVRSVSAKAGQKIKQQAEAIRLDDSRAALVLKRAKANLQAAQAEKRLAQGKGEADTVALAEARLEAAQADLDLAQLELDQLVVRAPFNGELLRVDVVEGQFVRAGERLGVLIDPTKLVVEVPVERAAAAPGGTVDIKVEETAVKAKVETVQALSPQFDALRELTVSPASAVVSIDNAAGKFHAGQTVYSDLIPLAPVALVPAASVSNLPDGNRKVQVLRDNVVRNLSIRILSKVGTENVFVSGRFSDGDEVIVSSSKELADGTPLRALAAASGAGKGNAKSGVAPAAGSSGGNGKQPVKGF